MRTCEPYLVPSPRVSPVTAVRNSLSGNRRRVATVARFRTARVWEPIMCPTAGRWLMEEDSL